MHKQELALNNLQGLICHKYQPTNLDCFRDKEKLLTISILAGNEPWLEKDVHVRVQSLDCSQGEAALPASELLQVCTWSHC